MSATRRTDQDGLLEVVPTIRFDRQRTTHGYRLAIEEMRVVVYTRCGIPLHSEEDPDQTYTMTHGVVSCEPCQNEPVPVAP